MTREHRIVSLLIAVGAMLLLGAVLAGLVELADGSTVTDLCWALLIAGGLLLALGLGLASISGPAALLALALLSLPGGSAPCPCAESADPPLPVAPPGLSVLVEVL